jgi:hypothetical protein
VVKRYWRTTDSVWWKGPGDQNVRVLRVELTSGSIWDGPASKAVALFEFIKAKVTGQKPNLGGKQKVRYFSQIEMTSITLNANRNHRQGRPLNSERSDLMPNEPKKREPDIPPRQPDIQPEARPQEIPQDKDMPEKDSPPLQT